MRSINIEITKAKLEGFTATFDSDDTLHLSATLALMTENGEKVSAYSLNTRTYYENKFNLPINVIEPIFKIAQEIEIIATKQCRSHHLELSAPTE
jgi:hypothetical protein